MLLYKRRNQIDISLINIYLFFNNQQEYKSNKWVAYPSLRECIIVTMHIEIIFKNYLGTHRCMFCFYVNFKLGICGLQHQASGNIYLDQSSIFGNVKNLAPINFPGHLIYDLHAPWEPGFPMVSSFNWFFSNFHTNSYAIFQKDKKKLSLNQKKPLNFNYHSCSSYTSREKVESMLFPYCNGVG